MLLIEEGNDYEDVDEADLPYSHLKNLGHGHSSIVEAVQDKVTKAIYARKTFKIPPSKTKRHEPIKVFRNEVKIIRNLGCHRHIIKVFATYTTTSNIGLILQPVADEGDLEDFLATYWNAVRDVEDTSTPNPRLDGMKLVMRHAFGCLIRGLAFMHDKKVRHKDIKPRNILIHNGRVIITDFGYSFDSNGRSRSATNGKPGPLTRKYSAIEVLQHEERDSRSDIYSLGCVFIELLSASSLVPDEFGCFSDNMHNIHQRLALWEVPSELSTLPKTITRMTMPKPSDRWCALHTAIEILRTPGLCCEDCRLNPVDPNKKCVKVGRCIREVKRTRKRPSPQQQGYSADLDPEEHKSKTREHEFYDSPSATTTVSAFSLNSLGLETTEVAPSNTTKGMPRSDQEAGAWENIARTRSDDDYLVDANGSIVDSETSFERMFRTGAVRRKTDWVEEGAGNQAISSVPGPLDFSGRTWSEPIQKRARRTREPYSMSEFQSNMAQHSQLSPWIPLADRPADLRELSSSPPQTYIHASPDGTDSESSDSRYHRIAKKNQETFFATGRVFKTPWSEPHDMTNPLQTAGSTHYSTVEYELSIQKIRTCLVVRNMGGFSDCIPIQTYRGSDETTPALTQQRHGMIYTCERPSDSEPGEYLNKNGLCVVAVGSQKLDATSRVNYGTLFTVGHNVKALNVGMVVDHQKPLIETYLQGATRRIGEVDEALHHTQGC